MSRRRILRLSVVSGIAAVYGVVIGIVNLFLELIGGVGWSVVLISGGLMGLVGSVNAYRLARSRLSTNEPRDSDDTSA